LLNVLLQLANKKWDSKTNKNLPVGAILNNEPCPMLIYCDYPFCFEHGAKPLLEALLHEIRGFKRTLYAYVCNIKHNQELSGGKSDIIKSLLQNSAMWYRSIVCGNP
jgi:hypothetical protein